MCKKGCRTFAAALFCASDAERWHTAAPYAQATPLPCAVGCCACCLHSHERHLPRNPPQLARPQAIRMLTAAPMPALPSACRTHAHVRPRHAPTSANPAQVSAAPLSPDAAMLSPPPSRHAKAPGAVLAPGALHRVQARHGAPPVQSASSTRCAYTQGRLIFAPRSVR